MNIQKKCRRLCGLEPRPDEETMEKMEIAFKQLSESNSKSLLKKHLTQKVFDEIKHGKTSFGSSLLDCIKSGVENLDSEVGIYAPDPEAYTVFADIFNPILSEYHNGFKKKQKQHAIDFGDADRFRNIDPYNQYVVSIRIRCTRSLHGYGFAPCLSEIQLKEIEKRVTLALSMLDGDLAGEYHSLEKMDIQMKEDLVRSHFLFEECNKFLKSANADKFWPTGRGIFFNKDKTFLVWVNEADHVKIISMQEGGDLGAVYRRLVKAVNNLQQMLIFAHTERLGYLTFCPTNLGTTLRASVNIRLPKLSRDVEVLEEMAATLNLQIRGTYGEYSHIIGGVYDISNKQKLGLTEFQAVKTLQDNVLELIRFNYFM